MPYITMMLTAYVCHFPGDLEVLGLKQEEEESESRWESCEQESESPEDIVKAWQTASPLKDSLVSALSKFDNTANP